ncbi:MAG: hypothetical protein IKC59_04205 [Clostridia bacterium]|nr:hypothetical protein [Clostridia bacterium]
MKKIICFVLCITTLLCSLSFSAFAAEAEKDAIEPRYNNVAMTDSSFVILSNGSAEVTVAYYGSSGITTGATITTQIQKKVLGLFWKKVDIGVADNTWVENVSDHSFGTYYTVQLTDKGTYRAKIHYTIYGTAGPADEIDDLLTYKYQ